MQRSRQPCRCRAVAEAIWQAEGSRNAKEEGMLRVHWREEGMVRMHSHHTHMVFKHYYRILSNVV